MLAGVVASIEYLASLDESARGTRRERLAVSMQSAASYLSRLFDYLMVSLRSLPLVMVIGRPEARDTGGQLRGQGGARRTGGAAVGRQRRYWPIANANSRVLDVIGVNDIGGAVTVGLAHYSTTAEVDQLVRALASLG